MCKHASVYEWANRIVVDADADIWVSSVWWTNSRQVPAVAYNDDHYHAVIMRHT